MAELKGNLCRFVGLEVWKPEPARYALSRRRKNCRTSSGFHISGDVSFFDDVKEWSGCPKKTVQTSSSRRQKKLPSTTEIADAVTNVKTALLAPRCDSFLRANGSSEGQLRNQMSLPHLNENKLRFERQIHSWQSQRIRSQLKLFEAARSQMIPRARFHSAMISLVPPPTGEAVTTRLAFSRRRWPILTPIFPTTKSQPSGILSVCLSEHNTEP